MRTVAPVAPADARLFTVAATTFEAISHDPAALEATIRESPSTIEVTTKSLKVQQPFLVNLNTLGQRADAGDRRAQGGAAGDQPRDRGRDQDAGAHAGAQREPAAGDGRAQEPVTGARAPTWPSTR